MEIFSNRWQVIAGIILVILAILYGWNAKPEPKTSAGPQDNYYYGY